MTYYQATGDDGEVDFFSCNDETVISIENLYNKGFKRLYRMEKKKWQEEFKDYLWEKGVG
jgi:hypothetical protein